MNFIRVYPEKLSLPNYYYKLIFSCGTIPSISFFLLFLLLKKISDVYQEAELFYIFTKFFEFYELVAREKFIERALTSSLFSFSLNDFHFRD